VRVWLNPLVKLALLDPQVARELGIVASNLLAEARGVFAADERLVLRGYC
jgi:hypothetical protein